MANNRIALKCRKCGDSYFLAKTMGDGWYRPTNDGTPPTRMLRTNDQYVADMCEFLTKHDECDDRAQGIMPIGGTLIEVDYEILMDKITGEPFDYLSTLSELADRLRILHSCSLEADGPNNEDLKRAYQAVIDDLKRAVSPPELMPPSYGSS